MSKSNIRLVDLRKIVKERISITQILKHYGLTGTFTEEGENLLGPCPLHNGTDPREFVISLARNCWVCRGHCKKGGNILDFVAQKERVSIRQSAKIISDWGL
jgi:DNA primase